MDPITLSLIIAGGGTLISGILNYMSSGSAQKANEKAYNKEYAQKLATEERNSKETKRVNDFTMKETIETKGYDRTQNAYKRGAELWAQSMNAQQAKVAPLIGRV